MSHRLLFICTANYYRSRYAELLFNARAGEARLDWEAFSRAVALEVGADNVGPISGHVISALEAQGIRVAEPVRFPLALREEELAQSDHVIALNEAEHRPYLAERFPAWTDRVEYWHVPDLDARAATEGLAGIDREVRQLVQRLAGS